MKPHYFDQLLEALFQMNASASYTKYGYVIIDCEEADAQNIKEVCTSLGIQSTDYTLIVA